MRNNNMLDAVINMMVSIPGRSRETNSCELASLGSLRSPCPDLVKLVALSLQ